MDKKRLTRLRITKVDLCKAGANPDADIKIFKSVDEEPIEKRYVSRTERDQMSAEDFAGPHESFPITKPEDVSSAGHLVGHAQDPESVKRRIIDIARRKGAAFTSHLPESWTISKENKSVPNNLTIAKVEPIDLTKATPEQIVAYAKSLETSVAAHEEEFAKAFPPKAKAALPKGQKKLTPPDVEDVAKDDDGDTDVAMTKALSTIQKSLDEQAVELKKSNDRADKLELELRKSRDEAELVTIEKSVEKSMPNVPGTVTEIAKMLQEAKATLTSASYAVLEKALKAGSEAIAKASTEIGSSKAHAIGTAEEEFFKAADELVEKKLAKTRPEAVVMITKTRTDLAEAYRLEKNGGRK